MAAALLCLLAAKASSATHFSHHSVLGTTTRVTSFGFSRNGTFEIDIGVSEAKEFSLLLAGSSETLKIQIASLQPAQLCNQNITRYANLSFTTRGEEGIQKWIGSIPSDDIYTLYIASCNPVSNINISCDFRNPGSLLDSRNDNVKSISGIFGVIYCLISAAWLLSAKRCRVYQIPLLAFFSLLPVYKQFLLRVAARICVVRRIHESTPEPLSFMGYFGSFLYYGTYLTLIAFASSGCTVYRSKYDFKEHMFIIMASALISGGMTILPRMESGSKIAASFIAALCGAFWYLSYISNGLIITTKIIRRIEGNRQLHTRVKRTRRFVVANYILVFIEIIGYSALQLSECPFVYTWIYTESINILLALIQAYAFLVPADTSSCECEAESSVFKPKAAILLEPGKRSFAMLQNL